MAIRGRSLAKSADSSSVEYGCTLPRFCLDLTSTSAHDSSTGWIKTVSVRLTNHDLCDIFLYVKKIVYKLMLGFHKIRDIINILKSGWIVPAVICG